MSEWIPTGILLFALAVAIYSNLRMERALRLLATRDAERRSDVIPIAAHNCDAGARMEVRTGIAR